MQALHNSDLDPCMRRTNRAKICVCHSNSSYPIMCETQAPCYRSRLNRTVFKSKKTTRSMTQPTSTRGIVSKAQLTELTIEALCTLGLTRADATDTATILVLADLFGLRTHGTSRIESYGSRLRIGGINATPSITSQQVGPALHRLDGDNGIGPLVGYRALDLAMSAAREHGI